MVSILLFLGTAAIYRYIESAMYRYIDSLVVSVPYLTVSLVLSEAAHSVDCYRV